MSLKKAMTIQAIDHHRPSLTDSVKDAIHLESRGVKFKEGEAEDGGRSPGGLSINSYNLDNDESMRVASKTQDYREQGQLGEDAIPRYSLDIAENQPSVVDSDEEDDKEQFNKMIWDTKKAFPMQRPIYDIL